MIELGYVLRRAWRITWEHKLLWVFGCLVGLEMMGVRIGVSGSQWALAAQELPPDLQQPVVSFLDGPYFTAVAVAFTLLGFVAGVGLSVVGSLGHIGLVNQTRAAEEYGIIVLKGGWLAGKRHLWRVFFIRLLLGLPAGVVTFLGLLPAIVAQLYFVSQGQLEVAILGELTVGLLRLICFAPAVCLSVLLSIPFGVLQRLAVRACVLEGLDVRASVVRAWEMLREHLGEVTLVWLALLGIGILVAIVIAMPLAVLAMLLWAIAGLTVFFSPLWSLALTWAVGLAVWLVAVAVGGVAETYWSATWTLAYRDLTGMGLTGEEAAPTPDPLLCRGEDSGIIGM
jgi:hypothetical protein